MEYHDENTMKKVHDVLDKVNSISYTAEDIINMLQNEGILFREYREDGVDLSFVTGTIPGRWATVVKNVWRISDGLSKPYRPWFTENELQDVAERFPEQIFFIGGIETPEGESA